MKRNEPFLAGFSKHLCGRAKRTAQEAMLKIRQLALSRASGGYALFFDDVLPAEFLAGIDQTRRNRHFGNIPVFWAWIGQILEHNASCSRALSLIQSWCTDAGVEPPRGDTSSYCQARKRLSVDFLKKLLGRIEQVQRHAVRPEDLWHGLTLKAIDGTSVKLMDTDANQDIYPQPSSQAEGCGFPVMGIVGLLNLSHGGWEGFTTGDWKLHDARAAQRLLEYIGDGDLVLADRAFSSYEYIARIQARGGECVMRLHQARHRKLDWRRGKKVSPIERLVTWVKPVKQPDASELSPTEWEQLPETLTMRYIKIGYENRAGEKKALVVVTTLLDPVKHDAIEVADLYAKRWDIELKFRDVKTTMGMEEFAVKCPAMAHKTLLMMMIAYNLLRNLMQRSATRACKPLTSMSFKGTLDVINTSHSIFVGSGKHHRKIAGFRDNVVEICATKILDIRPFRHEPRAIKRRPKPFQLLTKHRHVFREIQHKEGYKKAA